MADETDYVHDADPEQLARLLGLGGGEGGGEGDEGDQPGKAELLRRLMQSPLPQGESSYRSLGALLDRACRPASSVVGRTLKAALLDERTPVATLQAIKDHARGEGESASRGAARAVWAAVYYAAIASALVHHGRKITGYSRGELAESLSVFLAKDWMDSELAALFGQARTICEGNSG